MNKEDFEALAGFRAALRQFLKFAEASAEASGISVLTYQALLAMKGSPNRENVTIGELAANLLIRHHSAVGLANRLEAQGLVMRHTSAVDRRRVYLVLTPFGDRLVEDVAERNRRKLIEMKRDFVLLLDHLAALDESREIDLDHAA